MMETFQNVVMHFAICGLCITIVLSVTQSCTVLAAATRLLVIWRSLTFFGRVAVCAVFDIGDKNNNYSDPLQHAASPGIKWLAASGADTLLGCAYFAPTDEQGGREITQNWCVKRSSVGDVEAWMRANDCRSGHNACAI